MVAISASAIAVAAPKSATATTLSHAVYAGAHRVWLCIATAALVTAIYRAAKLRAQVGVCARLAFVLARGTGSTAMAGALALRLALLAALSTRLAGWVAWSLAVIAARRTGLAAHVVCRLLHAIACKFARALGAICTRCSSTFAIARGRAVAAWATRCFAGADALHHFLACLLSKSQ